MVRGLLVYALGDPLQVEGLGLPDRSTLEQGRRFSAVRPASHASVTEDLACPWSKEPHAGLFISTSFPGSSTHRQLGMAYVSATTGAVATALGLKSLTKVNAPPFALYLPPSSLSPPPPNL